MKKTFYTLLLFVVVITTVQLSNAQSPYKLNQVIVLNQGPYNGNRVTVGAYDPVAKSYQRFDSLPHLRFSNDVIIDSGFIYVAADSILIKYDLTTKQKLASQTVHGIREIAVWHNQLLVTRGDVTALTTYFQAYDKNTLNLVYELPSVSAATEGIRVLNDTAYVAVNGFGTTGNLAIIDLNKQVENREINLGADGFNPYDIEVEKTNNTIYSINNMNYTSTSITKYTPATGTATTKVVNLSSDCSSSTYYLNNIYFQIYGNNNIDVFNTSGFSIWDSMKINKPISGLAPDSVKGYMYVGNTDYTTYGKVFIYDLYSNVIDSFNSGITPGNFAFDVSTVTTGIEQISSFANLQLYPNPVNNELHVIMYDNKDAHATLTLTDILGRPVYQKQITTNSSQLVPMEMLSQGIYFLKVETANGELTKRIVKE